jgi:hypothetical protein
MDKKKHKETLERLRLENQLNEMKAGHSRAQSLTIGSAGNGCSEISMRANNGTYLYGIFQPVEIMEFIHQLAANIGCHIAITPRKDFASWRDWKQEDYMVSGNGFPPFSNDLALHAESGAYLPPPEEQAGLGAKTIIQEKEDAVATKKTIRRKTTKKARKTS